MIDTWEDVRTYNYPMALNASHHYRRSVRMPSYDYAQPGAYFVTICTHERAHLFGEIANGQMCLSACGQIVQTCWLAVPHHFSSVRLDAFVVMPNHFHAVVQICGSDIAGPALPQGVAIDSCVDDVPVTASQSSTVRAGTMAGSLSAIIQNFKSVTTRAINQSDHAPAARVWQRNYYEHVIRNEKELMTIRQYILNNPLKWGLDRENVDDRQFPLM